MPARRDAVVLRLTGEHDLATAPALADQLRAACVSGSPVIVDLEQVEFMDCAALRVLLEAAVHGAAAGRISVTPGRPAVRRLFALTGAERVLPVASGVRLAA